VSAKRADTERALRDIPPGSQPCASPRVILDRVVDEAMRLLGTDGAHLTRMGEDGTFLIPVAVDRRGPTPIQTWLLGLRFPIGGGINGLAAELGEPVWTGTTSPTRASRTTATTTRSPRGWASWDGRGAPPRAGRRGHRARSRSHRATPREFEPEERDLLQGLADQAAIAITNSTLLTR
jgi:GAF domain-containing protein